MSDDREITTNKIMTKLIPCKDDFKRMLAYSPDETKAIVHKKPMFPYSREQVEDMTKAEYREAFAKWENDRYGVLKDEELDEDTMYERFRDWNLKCMNDMYDHVFEDFAWLCDLIANGRLRNMDMKSTATFQTSGLYFNEDKQMVIYNGR